MSAVGRLNRRRSWSWSTPAGRPWSGASTGAASRFLFRPTTSRGPRRSRFPTTDGGVAHAFFYPPTNPGFTAPDGELPPLVVSVHGGPTSQRRQRLDSGQGVLHQPRLRRGRRELPRLERLRPRVHALARRQVGHLRRRRCIAAAQYLAGRGDVDGRRMAIRGGSAGGYTTLVRAGVPRRVRRRRVVFRRGRPGGAGALDAQVRVALPRSYGRAVAGGHGRLPRALAHPPRRRISRPLLVLQGRRRHGRAHRPGRGDRRGAAPQRRIPTPTCRSTAKATASARRPTSAARSRPRCRSTRRFSASRWQTTSSRSRSRTWPAGKAPMKGPAAAEWAACKRGARCLGLERPRI